MQENGQTLNRKQSNSSIKTPVDSEISHNRLVMKRMSKNNKSNLGAQGGSSAEHQMIHGHNMRNMPGDGKNKILKSSSLNSSSDHHHKYPPSKLLKSGKKQPTLQEFSDY